MKKIKITPLSLTILVVIILLLFLGVYSYSLNRFENHLLSCLVDNSKYYTKNKLNADNYILGRGKIVDNAFVLDTGSMPDDTSCYNTEGIVEVEKGIVIRKGNEVVFFAKEAPVIKILKIYNKFYILVLIFALVFVWLVFVLYMHFMRSVKILENSIESRKAPSHSAPNIKGFSGIFQGISRLYDELHKTENEVNRKSKLESLGVLLSKILHDLNNVISTLKIYHYIMNNTDDDAKKQECLNKINDSLENMTEMVSETFSFVRGEKNNLSTKVRVKDISNSIKAEYEEKAEIEKVNFQVQIDDKLTNKLISVNTIQIMSALRNLVQNAFEELNSCGNDKQEKIIIIRFKRLINDLQIEIQDNGRGLPVPVVERLFTPFVTEGKAQGTGLGISTAREYIEQNGGSIDVETGHNGTTFKIILPLVGINGNKLQIDK